MSAALTLAAVAAHLSRFGVTIRQEPGQYAVNFRGGREADAFYTDDLAAAYAYGLDLASGHRAPPPKPSFKRISRRALIVRHNRKCAAILRRRGGRAARERRRLATSDAGFSIADNPTNGQPT
jgi:hypothetical protein